MPAADTKLHLDNITCHVCGCGTVLQDRHNAYRGRTAQAVDSPILQTVGCRAQLSNGQRPGRIREEANKVVQQVKTHHHEMQAQRQGGEQAAPAVAAVEGCSLPAAPRLSLRCSSSAALMSMSRFCLLRALAGAALLGPDLPGPSPGRPVLPTRWPGRQPSCCACACTCQCAMDQAAAIVGPLSTHRWVWSGIRSLGFNILVRLCC